MRSFFQIIFVLFTLVVFSFPLRATETLPQKAESALHHSYISKINWQGKSIWIKGVEPSKKTLWHCYKKKLAAWLTPHPLFTPTVACGNQSLSTEKQRLILFQKYNVRVPMLIESGQDWLALEDLGTSLERVLHEASPKKRQAVLSRALDTLIDLHHKGLAHGRAMIKDMVVTQEGDIGFIDLAEDPQRYMTIDQARARDFLLFLFSAIPFLQQDQTAQQNLISHYMQQSPPSVKQVLKEIFIFLKTPYALASCFRHFFKKDGQRIFDAYAALEKYYAKIKDNE